jgi:hypothetical protein
MHIHFWSALQTHRWHHAPDPLKQRALLLYQSQQRCRQWHLSAGSSISGSLKNINDYLLLKAREDLFNKQCAQQTAAVLQVSPPSPPFSCKPLTVSYLPHKKKKHPTPPMHITCITC